MKPLLASALAAGVVTIMSPAVAAPPQRIFYSGHSLLDEPLPRDVGAIAASLGTPLQWQRHTPNGSSIRDRLAAGGVARPGPGFDALVVTEQHTLIGNLVWNDSVRQLRRLHDDFIAANPQGRTWFYAPWLNVDDRTDPRRWIAYERAASPVWQCVVARVDAALAAEGRTDRIAFVPAAALLAGLVERAARGEIPNVTVAALFRDDVHLTPLGSYFMSLVVFAALFERSPVGAAVPEGIEAAAGRALQDQAWAMVRQERSQREVLSPEACRERTQRFIAPYAAYVRDTVDRPRVGAWHAWWLWAKHRTLWHWALRD